MSLIKQLIILLIAMLILSGCWDEVEIEQRGFIFGVALDLAEEQSSSEENIELTSQFIIPQNLTSSTGSGGSGPAYRNITKTGETVFSANRAMMKQSSRVTDVTHLNLVLISEDFAKRPNLFKESIDVFLRERDMRRGIEVAIVNGTAKDLLTVEPEHEKIPTQYISKLLEIRGNLEIIETIRIGDIQENVLTDRSFPLPLLKVLDPKNVNYDGIAIFNGKKRKMVGSLKGDDATGLSFLIEDKHTGTLNIKVEEKTSTIEILTVNNKISLENKDVGNLQFQYNIDVKGTIAEQIGNQDVMDPKMHQKFENALSKKIEELTTKTVEKLQKDFQTDALGLESYLYSYHPKLWERVKDDWEAGENYFSTSKVNFKMNITIERPGNMNRTSDGGLK